MKKLFFILLFYPFLLVANDKAIPSKISEVTVYLSGAQITRSANCTLEQGTSELVFTGLSSKIDENSIQLSGLQSVSILSLSYDINYLSFSDGDPRVEQWNKKIEDLMAEVTLLKNHIAGLEEEEKVITMNRLVNSDNQVIDLEKVKEVSSYYRERTTAIKNEIFKTGLKINEFNADIRQLKKQLQEVNNLPEKELGELRIKFDAPVSTKLNLAIKYIVPEAGWIPNYDIKSKKINDPLELTYKAHVYQKTGKDWKDVRITLSTGNPNNNVVKPNLGAKYLNFVSRYAERKSFSPKKRKGYAFNPAVKKITGLVTDESGLPLPGVNVMVKGTTNGTSTDFDGYFVLEVSEGRELVFSYIGSKTQEVPIYSSVMNIQLEQDAMALDEVVVIGYGTRRSGTAGAVSSVEAENVLQGKASGIQIRGTSNIAKHRPPLYIIDGTPVSEFVEGDLDESEIQSIEVLKGSSAAAIYGNRGANGVVVITTKKSSIQEELTNTKFVLKKPYSIASDGDITALTINSFQLDAKYEYFAAPIVDENVFLTTTFQDWEKYNLLPGEANIYFAGAYSGKTAIDPYTVKKEMILSLGIEPNITVSRKQDRNFKSKSFTGSNRILNRAYTIEVKNNKGSEIALKLMDRIPMSQNKEIKVEDIEPNEAEYDKKKGLLTWHMNLSSKESKTEVFSFQVKYPRHRTISL